MILGYNTNGLAHHAPEEAIHLLHDIGYRAVGLTIDHNLCSPSDSNWKDQAIRLGMLCNQLSMTPVVETGARFLLDPWVKHKPTLISSTAAERSIRIGFLKHAVDVAAAVEAQVVSIWSGISEPSVTGEQLTQYLVEGLHELIAYASNKNVKIAFEPEPGMAIATLDDYQSLNQHLDYSNSQFGLTIDLGHLHCQDEIPIASKLESFQADILNLHIEDMCRGVHEHLMLGEGEIEFKPIINKLAEIQYTGPLCVELSRHSHDGVNAARKAFDFLHPLIAETIST